MVKPPVYRVLAPAKIDMRNSVALFAAENSDIAVTVRCDRAVEDPRNIGQRIAVYDRVVAVPPHRCHAVRGFVLPRHIRQSAAYDLDF